jgi:glyoxylase-like metal-dependent hydrolase (beta-lactamase superfamily II)/alkylhydroperoxidase family enzyme
VDNGLDNVTGFPYQRGWHRLGEHTLTWLEPDGGWGLANTGLVTDGSEALLVDTLFDLPHTKAMLDSVREVAPEAHIGTVVNTHANGDHFWGNQLVEGADIVASASTAGEMQHGPTAASLQQAVDHADSGDVFGAYLRDLNRDFDFSGIQPPAPTRVFSGRLEIPVGRLTATAIDMGAQHSEGDTVVWVPEDRVLFAGDLLFIGVHPVMWAGPIGNWIATCRKIEELGPRVVVPGHGPLIGVDGVRDFREYLEHVRQEATARYEMGMPWPEAAADISLGRWADWAYPERLAVTVSSVYRDLDGRGAGGTTMEEFTSVMTAVARIAAGVQQKPRLRPLQPGERDSATTALLRHDDEQDGDFARHTAGRPPLNVFTTLVRNLELFRRWAPLAAHLSDGSLPAKDRELAILRTAVRCGSPYEWAQHSALAAAAGLTAEEIARAARTTAASQWSSRQKAILDAVDQLHATSTVSQPTWEVLAGQYAPAELIELIVLIGHYHGVAFALNAFKTPTDAWTQTPGFPGMPAN